MFVKIPEPVSEVGPAGAPARLQSEGDRASPDGKTRLLSFLDRESTVAPPAYNRYLVPPAALAVHLSIGQAYAFSTFNLPLTKLLGISQSGAGDWTLAQVGWIFSLAIVFLGMSAAVFGRWVERAGPRKAMVAAGLCFGGGFLVAALGVHFHQLWLIYLGYGALGGCGLGIGYISPVSTLIKWFPDRPGLATGMAIMGFGGGAIIAAPLSLYLMNHFKTSVSTGVFETFIVMGLLYFSLMMLGAFLVRVPAPGWTVQAKATPRATQRPAGADVSVDVAWRTPQFWLLWMILCMNVTAGIGVLSQASPMIQEIFGGRVSPATGALFVSLLSLFNMAGRFLWAWGSDYLGRRNIYTVFFVLGVLLYCLAPTVGRLGSLTLFIATFAAIISMYGGGFATLPAYLRDTFGTMHVGAIHGRVLTAWSVAGVLGPVLVNYIRQYQIQQGVPMAQAYSVTMYIMCALLAVGCACNLAMSKVDARYRFRGP
jgi:MFS family permease